MGELSYTQGMTIMASFCVRLSPSFQVVSISDDIVLVTRTLVQPSHSRKSREELLKCLKDLGYDPHFVH